ncbi:MAG: ABC transporter permease, partial [Flavobacteriales bacterium]|nr:ABC transporter permease [Flavobacteriales bacterium]
MLLKLAWRNIWRNKRRTAITVASIFFAVFFAVFLRSMQLGAYAKMIDSVVRFYSGHVQVHAKGYWDDQTLDNSFDLNDPELTAIAENSSVEIATNRLESFALSSIGEVTKGVMMIGVDPQIENELMVLEPKVQSGALFGADDKSVMVGEKVAKFYHLSVGDTMVFLSQGYHGGSAAAKYPVAGIVKFTAVLLNEKAVLLPIKEAQNFFGAEGRATSFAVIIDNPNKMKAIVKELSASLDTSKYEVLDWEEAMPELVQAIKADGAGGIIMLMILYMVVSFGMFGTMLMLIQERTYEFGVLLSIGMTRVKLWAVVFLESIFTTLIGAVLGVLGVYPLVFYFNRNPYEFTGPSADAMLEQGWEPSLPASL